MPPDAARTAPVLAGRAFEDLAVGDAFTSALTITEQHLVTGAGLIADFNPLHVDETFAKASRYGGRILHGVLTAAVMGGPIGMIFYGTAIAYLEQSVCFRAPVRPGDTLTTTWTVVELVPKPQHGAGIVAMTVVGVNQDGVTVAEGEGKVLVACARG